MESLMHLVKRLRWDRISVLAAATLAWGIIAAVSAWLTST